MNSAGLGTTYKFPCTRLSFIDLFQEARWFFQEEDKLTWYNDLIRPALVNTRVGRFGILQGVCSSAGPASTSKSDACDHTIQLRTNVNYALEKGFPASYANPLLLFSDIGSLEMNHPCKSCIETEFENTMQFLTTAISGTFNVLYLELQRLLDSGTLIDPQQEQDIKALQQKVGIIASTQTNRKSVEEFYHYYVVRSLYAELGTSSYQQKYEAIMAQLRPFCIVTLGPDLCPETVTTEEALAALQKHADNTFSSITTAGIPFPFWSAANGTGYLFGGTEPVGGSGVDMSGQLLGTAGYLDVANYGNATAWGPFYGGGEYVDPSSLFWNVLVSTDPVYNWFMASVTPMTGSECSVLSSMSIFEDINPCVCFCILTSFSFRFPTDCGNGNVTGTNIPGNIGNINDLTAEGLAAASQQWCTQYNLPYETPEQRTQQHFAKMWYDLLIDSNAFLGMTQGISDPYVWTTGQGCGYGLGGQRDRYTGQNESTILQRASRELYYIDEGASIGAVDRNLIIGGATPAVGDYNMETNPLQSVSVVNTIYPAAAGKLLPKKFKNCNRGGGNLDITEDEGNEILYEFKKAFEERWIEGWDDPNAGEVQFVGFFDDQGGAIGTTGRILRDITLDNGALTGISIAIIAVFSAIFLFSCDAIQSKVSVTLVGVGLVIISFFGALGLGILCGIKVNIRYVAVRLVL